MTLIAVASALMCAILLHAVACRLPLRIDSVARFLVVGAIITICLIAVFIRTSGLNADAIGGLVVYAFGCELYIFLFTLSLGSLSANILALLARQPLTLKQLDASYSSEGMVSARIDRLLATGAISGDASSYSLTAKGRRLVGIFAALTAFFKHAERQKS